MIRVQALSYRYPHAGEDTLHALDFSFDKGEIFGFLGPSGAGKSTTQKILYQLLDGYSGDVLVEGQPLRSLGPGYRARVGVGFELPNHYGKLSARENLQLFAQLYRGRKLQDIDTLLARVGLSDAADTRVETFSKGMKMRLNFVRAIQHDPDILFFDEPTSGMDPGNAMLVKELILEQKALGKAIFITTHSMVTADQLCDRVAFLDAGRIVATDSPEAFKLRHGQDSVRVVLQSGQQAEFPLTGIGDNAAFLKFLQAGPLKTIHTQEASLEEVFLKLTGKSILP